MPKQCALILLSLMSIGYGTAILSATILHFEFATKHCRSLIAEQERLNEALAANATYIHRRDEHTEYLLESHSELFYWDFCEYKVYPFDVSGGDDVCQCRVFRMVYDKVFDSKNYHQIKYTASELSEFWAITNITEIIGNIFRRWHMMEKLEIRNTRKWSMEPLYLSEDMFVAEHLKVFVFTGTPIVHFDDAVRNWHELVYFHLSESELTRFPSSFSTLTNLEYLEHSIEVRSDEFPIEICALHRLKVLKMALHSFTTIPGCICNLTKLESLILEQNERLQYIPMAMLAMDSLKELSLEQTNVSVQALLHHNNITLDALESEQLFLYKPDTKYWLQGTWYFCEQYSSSPHSFPLSILEFINSTKCCDSPCHHYAFSASCRVSMWRDGICDDNCDHAQCSYDGGDCLQLCDLTECALETLGDGHCDFGCNASTCNYDEGDCAANGGDAGYAECDGSHRSGEHECHPEWLQDGWCDMNCQNAMQCNDDKDCDAECDGDTNCHSIWVTFEAMANYKTHDDRIDEEELCLLESSGILVLNHLLKPSEGEDTEYADCSDAFGAIDVDSNGYLELNECLPFISYYLGISLEKALQIDCSMCGGV